MRRERLEEVEVVARERCLVAIDVSNLWRAARELYGPQARVDFLDLLRRVREGGFQRVERNVRAVAFTVTAPHRRTLSNGQVREEASRNERFLLTLKRFGYEVRTRTMRYEKGIQKPFHSDWDVGIAVETMATMAAFDTFILASGDGDYQPLMAYLRSMDRRIEVYTFRSSASPVLYDHANEIHYLDDADIYREKSAVVEG